MCASFASPYNVTKTVILKLPQSSDFLNNGYNCIGPSCGGLSSGLPICGRHSKINVYSPAVVSSVLLTNYFHDLLIVTLNDQ